MMAGFLGAAAWAYLSMYGGSMQELEENIAQAIERSGWSFTPEKGAAVTVADGVKAIDHLHSEWRRAEGRARTVDRALVRLRAQFDKLDKDYKATMAALGDARTAIDNRDETIKAQAKEIAELRARLDRATPQPRRRSR